MRHVGGARGSPTCSPRAAAAAGNGARRGRVAAAAAHGAHTAGRARAARRRLEARLHLLLLLLFAQQRDLLTKLRELGDVALGLRAHVGRERARVELELLDALVAQRDLLLALRVVELERRVLAQQLPVHGDELLEPLLQRAHVLPLARREELARVAHVGPHALELRLWAVAARRARRAG